MSGMGAQVSNKKKNQRGRRAAFRFFIFIFIVALTVVSSYISYSRVMESSNKKEVKAEININPEDGMYLEIPRGAGTEKIADILKEKGLIKYPRLFKILSMVNGYEGTYQSGTHIISRNLKYDELMRILSSKPESIKVTIPEGYTIQQMVEVFKKNKLTNGDEFIKAANTEKFDFKFLEGIPPERENKLEGYLFPDTYEFDMNATEKDIINTLLRNFSTKFKAEYQEKAEKMNMTVDQIITLASIIEREAKNSEERSIIAGIFYNRLKSKDKTLRKLQSCATIQYIYLVREGIIKETITDADTKIDSPYNTYQVEGLPPGPICCPGEDSIKAALFPEETDYLYFVARGDGTHKFSKTYKEHQAAMKEFGVSQ
jgi:UPF0755 protein